VVSNVQRFLAGRTPGGPEAHGVWVLHGPAVQAIFFHDIYHGCTRIWHSLALWALHDWSAGADPDPPLVVVLTSRGALGFHHNADPVEAEQRFYRTATLAKPRNPKDPGVEPAPVRTRDSSYAFARSPRHSREPESGGARHDRFPPLPARPTQGPRQGS
jgi:hypothetical protein